MSDPSLQAPAARLAVLEALKVGAPGALSHDARRTFPSDGTNLVLADLGMDSLGEMEFCIAIELATGVTLVPSELAELATTDAVERRIRDRLSETASSRVGVER